MIESDIKYPTDAGLAVQGVKSLAREGRKVARAIGEAGVGVRDRSRSMGRRLRAITRTIRRRSGQAKTEILDLTGQTGELLARSVKEARRLATMARRRARGRGAQAKLRAAAKLDELVERCEKIAIQIGQRVRGEKITDRLISLSDPDARPIRKGKLGKPTEFANARAAVLSDSTSSRGHTDRRRPCSRRSPTAPREAPQRGTSHGRRGRAKARARTAQPWRRLRGGCAGRTRREPGPPAGSAAP